MSEMTPADLLEGAADVLITKGWTRGRYEHEGTYCLLGAMRRARFGETWRDIPMSQVIKVDSVFTVAAESMLEHLNIDTTESGLGLWNDTEARNVDEVVEALRQTAKDLRNQEPAQ